MSALRDALRSLDPLHEATARFRRGGERCAQDIERLHAMLVCALAEFKDAEEALEDTLFELETREPLVTAEETT